MTDFFSFLESDLPGQIPPAPNVVTGPVGSALQRYGKLGGKYSLRSVAARYASSSHPDAVEAMLQRIVRANPSLKGRKTLTGGFPLIVPRDVPAPFRPRTAVLDYLVQLFKNQGLPESLARWAYDVVVEGASGTELVQRMYERPEFKDRFQALFRYRENLPNAPAISPQEVLTYERDAISLMRAAGMPAQFYDHYSDFTDLIGNGVSFGELTDRVNDAYMRVATAPRGVRDAFTNFFGPSGDAGLAAMFLDPTKALPALKLQVNAAGVAGTGLNFGFTLGKERAMEAAQTGFDMDNAADRWTSLVQARPLFNETISEQTDLRAEEEGAAAVFGLSGGGAAITGLERRREERVAAFSGGGGAAGDGRVGAKGLGSAR